MSGPRVSRYRAFAGKCSPPASLCEGGGPAGPEGENLAIARNISDSREVLSPTRCGGSPLPEGAKKAVFPVSGVCGEVQGRACPAPYVRSVWFRPPPVGISLPGRPLSQRFLIPP